MISMQGSDFLVIPAFLPRRFFSRKQNLNSLVARCSVLLVVVCSVASILSAQTVAGNFGAVNIGTTSSVVPLVFTFETSDTLGSTAVLTQGVAGLDFADSGSDTCTANTTYTVGQSCTVNVTFTPKFAGIRYGAVVLEDSSGNPIATGYLQGTGVGPQIIFQPSTQCILLSYGTEYTSLAVDGSGDIYYAEYDANEKITPPYEMLAVNGTVTPWSTIKPISALFGNAIFLTIDASGDLYVADYYNNLVKEILAVDGTIPVSPTIRTLSRDFDNPDGLAVDGNGNLYVSSFGDSPGGSGVFEIVAVNGMIPDSPAIRQIGSGFFHPVGVAVDASGNVYVGDSGNNAVKEVVAVNGSIPASPVIKTLGSGFDTPYGITLDGSGNVYVADFGDGTVKEIEAVNGIIPASPVIETLGSGFGQPAAVAVDGGGNVYVANLGNGSVEKLDFTDPPSLTFAGTVIGSNSPQTITIENVGNAALTFPIPSTGNNPSITGDFTLDDSQASACPVVGASFSTPATLTMGASCQLSVSFAPTAAGNFSGSLSLIDDNLNAAGPAYATQSILLNGTGLLPTPTINWPTPAAIYSGTALSSTQLDATASVPGTFTYTPSAGTLLAAGTQTLSATFTPSDTTDYASVTASVQLRVYALAALTSPSPGTVLPSSSTTFQWFAGTGPTNYELRLGTTGVGSQDLFNSDIIPTTSVPVTNLPTDGQPVYARLYSEINGVWQYIDYTYTASGTLLLAALTSPTPSAVLPGAGTTFTWSQGNGPTAYELRLGTTGIGSADLFNSGIVKTTSATVTNVPTDGQTVYARLYSEVSGAWQYVDSTYTSSGTVSLAALTSPTPTTVLPGTSATFTWSQGNGPTAYELRLGTTGVGSANLDNSGIIKSTHTSVSNLPTNGITIYARLFSQVSGVWQWVDYTYTSSY